MATYSIEELVSSTILVKNFSSYLTKIKNHEINKVWILKNNKLDAVLISKEDYDRVFDILEHIEIYDSIKDRIKSNSTVWFDEMLNKFNIKL